MRLNASGFAEPVAVAVFVLIAVSLWQGMKRGASGSAKHLLLFLWEAVSVIASLAVAVRTALALAPVVELWLRGRDLEPPAGDVDGWSLAWHTLVTSVRDFSLLRLGLLFLVSYIACRLLLRLLSGAVLAAAGFGHSGMRERADGSGALGLASDAAGSGRSAVTRRAGDGGALGRAGGFTGYGRSSRRERPGAGNIASRITGAGLGAVHGGGRALVLVAVLFIYVSLLPHSLLAERIESSPLYREAAERLLKPVAGGVMAKQGPVLTRAVEAEFKRILERRYEIIDRDVPDDIRAAAIRLTEGAETREAKARALYDWVGTRIQYDWDKADAYNERGEWREQTPEDTFRTRRGVCIDIARLYAVMARSAGLEVRVVTGLGADGRGGFGPHAWNEVRTEAGWVPLDATWAASGDWFNPPDFDVTHLRDV